MEEEFFPPEENDFDYQVNLSIEDIHLLHYCVLKRIETWEGSPSRHPQEQEHLWYCLLYTSPSPRDRTRSRMPSSA